MTGGIDGVNPLQLEIAYDTDRRPMQTETVGGWSSCVKTCDVQALALWCGESEGESLMPRNSGVVELIMDIRGLPAFEERWLGVRVGV